MIRVLLFALLILALGAGAAYFLRADTGYVVISFQSWVIETTLAGLVVTVVAAALLVMFLLRLLVGGIRLPGAVGAFFGRRREDRARQSFEKGLGYLFEGRWKRAEVELVRRAADHASSHLNYLGAARAAQRMGAAERRDHYLHLAEGSEAAGIDRAALLSRTELQIERGEFVAALDSAQRLRALDPGLTHALALQAEALFGLGEWEPLRKLLTEEAAASALTVARRREMLERALVERIRAAESEARLEQVKALWDAAGPESRRWPPVRLQYARSLVRLNAQAEALALAGKVLRQEWDAGMAEIYGQIDAADPVGQLASIEQWLSRYGERTELLLAAGRACLRNRLWGKARSYLDSVLRIAPSAAVYLELARVCEQTRKPEEAQQFYRKGLELAAQ